MSSYSSILSSVEFYQSLLALDEDVAAKVQDEGCSCGGTLHHANYPRNVLGILEKIAHFFGIRFSFCCAEKNCRKRRTPSSVRFLGRRRFSFLLILLASVLTNGVNARRLAQLQDLVPVSETTLRRWRKYWQKEFITTACWRKLGGMFVPMIDPRQLPDELLNRSIIAELKDRVISILSQLSSLSTTSCGGF